MSKKTVRNQTNRLEYAGILLLMVGVALPLFGFALPSPLATVQNPRVRTVDTSGNPVSGAYIFLFADGSIQDWSNADYMQLTDSDGYAEFAATGFFQVGVVKDGYEAPVGNVHHVPSEWSGVYSAWGAGGLTSGSVYTIPLEYTGVAVQEPVVESEPTETEPTETDSPTETVPSETEPEAKPTTSLASAFNYVTIAGIALVFAGLMLGRKRK